MQVGDKQLVVQRSSLDGAGRRADMFAGGILPVGINMEQDSEPTTVLVLLNMVTVEELADEAEYEGAYACRGGAFISSREWFPNAAV